MYQPILLRKDFSSMTTLPDEAIIVDKKPVENNVPTTLSLQIKLTLGKDTFIAYQNLQTKLRGSLLISQELGRPPTASGELYTIKGNYRAYGNSLRNYARPFNLYG